MFLWKKFLYTKKYQLLTKGQPPLSPSQNFYARKDFPWLHQTRKPWNAQSPWAYSSWIPEKQSKFMRTNGIHVLAVSQILRLMGYPRRIHILG